jgi:endo-1,4-beta-D-glucanase Y
MLRRLVMALGVIACGAASAQEDATVLPAEWSLFKERFVRAEGRVVDNANGDISHSEGQGYGMLLAYLADNAVDFERIWGFTRTELLLRDDGLAAWRWEEAASPHVTDTNNASDGDILIAYALALAGKAWSRPDYLDAARRIARSLAKVAIVRHQGRSLLLPGAAGFSRAERDDGPVVNLSYWVFEAFPVLDELAPDAGWPAVADGGRALLDEALFSDRTLPPDWLSVRRRPQPADGFAFEFGYNAVRIPLYLIRAGMEDGELLQRLSEGMAANGGIAVVNLTDGSVREPLSDRGYRIIQAAAACVLGGAKMESDLALFDPQLYYPATLQLLTLAHLRREAPQCL